MLWGVVVARTASTRLSQVDHAGVFLRVVALIVDTFRGLYSVDSWAIVQ